MRISFVIPGVLVAALVLSLPEHDPTFSCTLPEEVVAPDTRGTYTTKDAVRELFSKVIPYDEPMSEVVCPLVNKDKSKPVKVLLLVKSGPKEPRISPQLENDLSRKLEQALLFGFKRNGEEISIVKQSELLEYKHANPDWRSEQALKIGHTLKIDYVLEFEIIGFSIKDLVWNGPFGPATEQAASSPVKWFRGTCDISVRVLEVCDSELGPKWLCEYSTEFPTARGSSSIPGNVDQFRDVFLRTVARRLSWCFTSHPVRDYFAVE